MFLFRKRAVMPSPEDTLPGRPNPIPTAERHFVNGRPLKGPYPDGVETIVLGLGCFWGAERKFWQLPQGVHVTAVGYAAGTTPNPTYEETCTGLTGHTEAVLVVFDPEVLPVEKLLAEFFEWHDPTQGMRQGNDVGTQYRTGVYYTDDKDLEVINQVFDEVAKKYDQPLAVEKEALQNFVVAEDYHQDYLKKNPNGYCHVNLLDRPDFN